MPTDFVYEHSYSFLIANECLKQKNANSYKRLTRKLV